MTRNGPYLVPVQTYRVTEAGRSQEDSRRRYFKYPYCPVATCTDDILVSRHETYGRHGVIVAWERLRILPFILSVPDFDEEV
jgi:hypothetical protein